MSQASTQAKSRDIISYKKKLSPCPPKMLLPRGCLLAACDIPTTGWLLAPRPIHPMINRTGQVKSVLKGFPFSWTTKSDRLDELDERRAEKKKIAVGTC